MFDINSFIREYREEEITSAMRKFFSDKPTVHIRQNGNGSLVLAAPFTEYVNGRSKSITANMEIDEQNDELISSACECEEFKKNYFACRHTSALMASWLEKTYGDEAIKESGVKDILVRNTGLSEPFSPGALRETNENLKNIIGKSHIEKPVYAKAFYAKADFSQKLGVQVILHMDPERSLELKIVDKKAYVIKDLADYLRKFDKGQLVTYGKLSSKADLSLYDDKSRRILECLIRVTKSFTKNMADYVRFAEKGRIMNFGMTEYDGFMEVMDGFQVQGNSFGSRTVNLSDFIPEISVEKQDYGTLIKTGAITKLAETLDYIYVLYGWEIRRFSKDNTGFNEILLALGKSEPDEGSFIARADEEKFLGGILPVLVSKAKVVSKGFELAQYVPEKPQFKLYFDYPDENIISCRALAEYSNKTYSVGTEEDRSKRDVAAENALMLQFRAIFNGYNIEDESFVFSGFEEDIYNFLSKILPAMEKLGQVFISDKIKKMQVRKLRNVSVGINVENGILTMNLSSSVFTDDELIEILSAYKKKTSYYRLKSGAFVQMDDRDEATWATVAECIKGMRKPNSAEWKLPAFRALYLEEMLKDREVVKVDGNEEYKLLVSNMNNYDLNEEKVPVSLESIMRDYQKNGFQWVRTLKKCGFGGILADDMGLGKTLQIIAFLLKEKEEGKSGDLMRTLIICPASLVYNWRNEIRRFAPSLKIITVTGSAAERSELISADRVSDVWITSYELLRRDFNKYENVIFANEIIDEAQYIKNQNTESAKAVRLINSGFRMALTGTPIENRLSEMWSIFDYLMPGFLYTYTRFKTEIESPIVLDRDTEVLERMRKLVHPFILRRLKGEVLKELPEKLEEHVTVSMSGEQKRLYLAHAQRLKKFIEKQNPEEFSKGKLEVLAELTKLRQLCCAPELVVEGYKGDNCKLDACMELISESIDGGHKLLLFSQFTSMLDIIEDKLNQSKIKYYRIDGSVSKEDRINRVEKFQNDQVPVFLISLKAGGTGLNLTAADIVIHYDPWWNVAAENQATDRTHRIGQKNVVTVYKLIAEDTIEDKIRIIQESKARLADDILSGDEIASTNINREEILGLL